jgi:hypothetical protein
MDIGVIKLCGKIVLNTNSFSEIKLFNDTNFNKLEVRNIRLRIEINNLSNLILYKL